MSTSFFCGQIYKGSKVNLGRSRPNAYYKIMKGKAKNLYYMTFEELGLSMDSQTDGIHASDLGMQQYADAYFKKILSIL